MSAKLTPRQRAYVRKRTTPHEPDPSEVMGELNIVPFLDIVVNIIIFLLATTQYVLAVAEIEANLPTLGRRVGQTRLDDQSSNLNLTVIITRAGVSVGASGGWMAPGCTTTTSQGGSVAVPTRNGRYDWAQLTACARRIKGEFPNEKKVIVSADPEIEFEHLIGAMDALRSHGTEELFPEVMISAGLR
jgi:biopolymer transport protein ExbD